MEALDYWKLCDRITIFQAIMLIIGLDPESDESWKIEQRTNSPEGYGAVKTALVTAVKKEILDADICEQSRTDEDGNEIGLINDSVDVDRSFVNVASLKKYLKDRDFETGFFFPTKTASPDYLDTKNSCYAPKLAAAVSAWQAVTSEELLLIGKTPKQALEVWLRKHADEFGLTKEDGSPNEQGIEEISKIANWNIKGGAPRTPF